MSNGKDFNEFLDEFAEMLADKLVEKSKNGKIEEEIKELEQTNHEITEKNKALLEENKNLRQEKEYFQDLCNDLREKLIEWYQKNILNEADKNILFYQEQNLKLMESNKALVEEVEKLKKQNKELLLQNIELDEKLKETDKLKDITWNKI